LISNYATDVAMDVCDGGMVERFGCAVSNINALMDLVSKGKLAQVIVCWLWLVEVGRGW